MDYIHFKKRIIVNTQYSMMFFAVLSDYDLLSLTDLDNLTLYKLAYLEDALLSDYDLLSLSDLDNLPLYKLVYNNE